MAQVRNVRKENSPEYQRGYRDAQADMKRDLAAILRTHAVGSGGEELSDQKVREIFTGVFGYMATEEEFGPEPTGAFDVERLVAYATEAEDT